MLSLKHISRYPIAIIKGGPDDNKIVYLHDIHLEDNPDYFYQYMINEGSCFILPETRGSETDRIIFAGPSGVGKTTMIDTYCELFRDTFPQSDRPIMFTIHPDEDLDKTYDCDLNIIQIDESILEDPIVLEDIAERNEMGNYIEKLIIFDDYRGNSKLIPAINDLRTKLYLNGRKFKLYTITADQVLERNNPIQRHIIENSNKFVFFTKSRPANLQATLEKYFDIPEEEYKQLIKPSIISKSLNWQMIRSAE